MNSLTPEITRCLKLLSNLYQAGSYSTSHTELFPAALLNESQMLAVIRVLEEKGAIKTIPVLNKAIPPTIQICPKSIELASQIKSKYSYDSLIDSAKSNPWISIPMFIVTSVLAIVGFVKLVWPELFVK